MENSIKELFSCIEKIKKIGKELGYDNILYNEQYKELEISLILGHKYNEGQGQDAVNNINENCEYKTINGEKGSFQYHWISKNKLDKLNNTPHHYFVIYDKETGRLDKIYYLHISKFIKEIESVYLKSEANRKLLNSNSDSKKSKSIDAHKSFSLKKIKSLGGELIYNSKK